MWNWYDIDDYIDGYSTIKRVVNDSPHFVISIFKINMSNYSIMKGNSIIFDSNGIPYTTALESDSMIINNDENASILYVKNSLKTYSEDYYNKYINISKQ